MSKEDKQLDEVLKVIHKKYGAGSIIDYGNVDKIEPVETISTGLATLDLILGGGVPKGRIMEVYGPYSCIADTTHIQYDVIDKISGDRINHKGGSIQMLYERFHKIKSGKPSRHLRIAKQVKYFISSINEKDKIIKNEILDVIDSGIKETYLVTTSDGNSIVCTKEHKFYIGGGKYKALKDLKESDIIMQHNNTRSTKKHKKIRYSEVMVKYHSKAKTKKIDKYIYYRLKKHKAIYEAYLNNVSYETYIKMLNSLSILKIDKLKTIPEGKIIHHKDHNYTNNNLANLQLMSKKEHEEYHGKFNAKDLFRFKAVPDTIETIEYVGEIQTYDIACKDPYNNYVANKLIVHNSGKTTLSLQMLAKCQQDGKRVAFIDVENALDIEYAQKMGIDTDKLLLSQPDSGESAMDIVEKLCQSNQVSCIVIDSVAQLVPMSVANKEIDGTANIATTARLLSQTLPRISNAASRSGTILIFINQIRMNVGQLYGNPETTPGGMALKFASSVRVEVRGGKPEIRNGKEGTVVRVNIKKNKIARPFRKAELFLIYGEGFDTIQNLLDTALFAEIIKQAGGWFSYGEFKEQGWLKLVGVLRNNEGVLKEIEEKLKKIKV